MKKADFLRDIEARISALPEKERRESIDYFSEMIDERIEDGMSEEEAVDLLGSPEEIAANIIQEAPTSVQSESVGGDSAVEIPQDFTAVGVTEIDRYVDIIPSSDNKCRVEYKDVPGIETKVYVKDGCLHVEAVDQRRWFHRIRGSLRGDDHVFVFLPAEKLSSIRVNTVSGDVKLCQVCADEYHITTANGDVKFYSCTAKELHISTTNGDVELCGDPHELHINTVTGDINGRLGSRKNFKVQTVVGDVRVPQSDPQGGKCSLTTVNGDISIEID